MINHEESYMLIQGLIYVPNMLRAEGPLAQRDLGYIEYQVHSYEVGCRACLGADHVETKAAKNLLREVNRGLGLYRG